ncbi:MAG: hypothetical protein M1837_001299 [Sclerophora amabilis]|nr:MAG: hypothetical protein M1837_001299 [Sclerophora amabilis]
MNKKCEKVPPSFVRRLSVLQQVATNVAGAARPDRGALTVRQRAFTSRVKAYNWAKSWTALSSKTEKLALLREIASSLASLVDVGRHLGGLPALTLLEDEEDDDDEVAEARPGEGAEAPAAE